MPAAPPAPRPVPPASARRRPPRPPLRHAAGPLLLTAAFAAQTAGALRPHVPLLAASVAAGLAAEALLYRRQRRVVTVLARIRADAALRQLLRDLLLVIAVVAQHGPANRRIPLVLALLTCYALHFLTHAAALVVRRTRTLPVLTRNIDTSGPAGLGLTPAPPAFLMRRPGRRILLLQLPATAGLLATASTGAARWAAAGTALTCAGAAVGLGVLLVRLLPGRRPPGEEAVLAWFDAWLAAYRPTVGMYFSGARDCSYQANMWLEPLARLDGRPLIVLRERHMMQRIAATCVPVVCLPKVAHLLRLEQSTLRMLIHPANSGKTSQVLRIPTLKHAFVNHGESDKLSSCNPYAKAYDEVWVAGPAARARYALAETGVDDRDVAEIGRPQLDPVLPGKGAPEGPCVTVLYAPTWEGWDGNPGNTSLVLAGENIVRALLADPGVRLLYRPHPMTGSVDPRAAEADARIRALVAAADTGKAATAAGTETRSDAASTAGTGSPGHTGDTGDAEGPVAGGGTGDGVTVNGAEALAGRAEELARRTAELDRVTATVFRPSADDMERMLLQTAPEPGRAAAVAAAAAAWDAAYWAALPAGHHQVLTAARPELYACFNQADVLVADVSSVVSDFLASGKPYAVANTSGLDEEAFRAAFPTVRAAVVLAPDASQVPELLRAVRDPRSDVFEEARAELRLELLGPPEPPSVVRFADAARALGLRAAERRDRLVRRAVTVPGQTTGQPAGREQAVEIPGQSASRRPGSRHGRRGG